MMTLLNLSYPASLLKETLDPNNFSLFFKISKNDMMSFWHFFEEHFLAFSKLLQMGMEKV